MPQIQGLIEAKKKEYRKSTTNYHNFIQEVAILILWIKMGIIAVNIFGVNGVPQLVDMEVAGDLLGVHLKIML